MVYVVGAMALLLVKPKYWEKNLISIHRTLTSRFLVFHKFGEPNKVIKLEKCEIPALGNSDVLVRLQAAPINPADINTVQGKYPVKISLPCIGGNEGVGIVEEIGKHVEDIKPGDKVVLKEPAQGTWRDIGVFKKNVLKIVPHTLDVVEAATLMVNPCTAYRMLTDFKRVRDGGMAVIQNGANGACGQYVIQLCNVWCVPNVNIVRDRPDIKELKSYLKCLGATYVLTEGELMKTKIFKGKKIIKPSLALNCVGGKNALAISKQLDHSGTMVTYGGMSKKPVTVPNGAFIFKNQSYLGFWMTAWHKKVSQCEREAMWTEIIDLFCNKQLKGPVHKLVKFENYQDAFKNALSAKGFTGCKFLLDMTTTLSHKVCK